MNLWSTPGAGLSWRGAPVVFILLACTILTMTAQPRAGWSNEAGRVVVLRTSEDGQATETFVERLAAQLVPLEVGVDAETVEALPTDDGSWQLLAEAFAKKKAGTLALIWWSCEQKICSLTFLEPLSGARLVFPVESNDDLDIIGASAATAREMLVSELLPLLSDLDEFAGDPNLDPGRVSPERFFAVDRGQFDLSLVPPEKTLWLEGGYQGEAYHPGGDISNGAWMGVVFAPTQLLRGALSLGWSGFREGDSADTVDIQRAYALLGLRVVFALGAAEISIAPIARFDLVFANFDSSLGATEDDTRFEMQAGGVTHWKLPLPWNIDALFGVGILATVVGDDYRTSAGAVAAERSALLLFWQAGFAYSLF